MNAQRTRHRRLRSLMAMMLAGLLAGAGLLGVATPAGAAVEFPTTSYGDTGTNVTTIQYLLRAYGHDVEIDGEYGPKMRDAMKSFQSKKGVEANGEASPETMKVLAVPAKPGDSNKNTVKAVQTQLKKHGHDSKVDGSYDDETRDQVKAFQAKNKLSETGSVDGKTWPALFGAPPAGPIFGVPQEGTGSGDEQWNNCGPASMVMALLRVNKTPAKFTEEDKGADAVYHMRHTTLGMKDPSKGTSQIGGAEGVAGGFAKYDVSTTIGSVDAAMKAAKSGKPSVVAGNARVTAGWWESHVGGGTSYLSHWIFLAGYNADADRYIVVDPLAHSVVKHEISADALAAFNKGSEGSNVITK